MHLIEHLCQIGAQTVLAVLECRWEERHDIKVKYALAIENQRKLSLGIVGGRGEQSRKFSPLLAYSGLNISRCKHLFTLLVAQHGLDATLICSFRKEAKSIGTSLYGIDTPEAFVDETGKRLGGSIDGQFQGIALSSVQQFDFLAGLDEPHVDG